MSTLIFTHPDCLEHNPGAGHPERPERLEAVLKALDAEPFGALERRSAEEADLEQLCRVHDSTYVDDVLGAVPARGVAHLDPDTALSSGSRSAILRAAGAVCGAVDAVLAGEASNAFCAVRPCGHHAEPDRAMGFCLFNNVAVGAAHARQAHGLSRVAIIDFDVHHGNGTQTMVSADPGLFFASTHQWPLYPGTGAREERGRHGNIVNAPLASASGSAEFRQAMQERVLPALEEFQPGLILVSAGFDAHARDPLAQLALQNDDFAWITREILAIAGRVCNGRVVSVLEGGYDLQALAQGCEAHVQELMAG